LGVVLVAFALARVAGATDAFEIQVYDPGINAPLSPGIEIHVNYVARGLTEPSYQGAVPMDQLIHVTFEPSFGVTTFWELGGYLQLAVDPKGDGGQAWFAGWKLRSKFVLPEDQAGIFDLGVNLEFSDVPHRFEEGRTGAEVRPILGIRYAGFRVDANPILSWGFGGTRVGVPDFEPCIKATWDTTLGFTVGFEYYSGLGPIDHIPRFEKQEHYAYAVLDLLDGPLEVDVGVGRGLTEASNDWTLKAIVGKSF
jgi:hypothetical protein